MALSFFVVLTKDQFAVGELAYYWQVRGRKLGVSCGYLLKINPRLAISLLLAGVGGLGWIGA